MSKKIVARFNLEKPLDLTELDKAWIILQDENSSETEKAQARIVVMKADIRELSGKKEANAVTDWQDLKPKNPFTE